MHEQLQAQEVLDKRFEFDSEGFLVEYFEQYEGYYSKAWRTSFEPNAALEALHRSELLKADPDYEIQPLEDGSWYVHTLDGSFYWTVDMSGVHMAGVLSPDDGLSEKDIEAWRELTAASDLHNGN